MADALELSTIRERARVAGVLEPRVEQAPVVRATDRVRIRCSVPMARFLADECSRLTRTDDLDGDRERRLAFGCAIASLFAAIHDASQG